MVRFVSDTPSAFVPSSTYYSLAYRAGLCQEDIQLVFSYLTTGLFPAADHFNPDTRSVHTIHSNASSIVTHRFGSRFLTGPADMNNHSSETRLPRVFLNHSKGSPDECHLVVYRISNVTVCLFIPASYEPDRDFFFTLDSSLAPRMVSLSADVAEQAVLRKSPSAISAGNDASVRFLYFNQWNMAFKSTLHQSSPGHRRVLLCQPSASNDVIKVAGHI